MRSSRRRGASLLEVLTATAIMVSVLGIGIPSLVRLRAPYVLSAAISHVAADLQNARMRAIARNTRYRVAFDPATRSYTLEREAAPGVFVPDSARQELPAGATLGEPDPAHPIFDTRGMLAADVEILVSVGGRTKRLTINVLGKTTIS